MGPAPPLADGTLYQLPGTYPTPDVLITRTTLVEPAYSPGTINSPASTYGNVSNRMMDIYSYPILSNGVIYERSNPTWKCT